MKVYVHTDSVLPELPEAIFLYTDCIEDKLLRSLIEDLPKEKVPYIKHAERKKKYFGTQIEAIKQADMLYVITDSKCKRARFLLRYAIRTGTPYKIISEDPAYKSIRKLLGWV